MKENEEAQPLMDGGDAVTGTLTGARLNTASHTPPRSHHPDKMQQTDLQCF
jgi:hypothetical protein